MGLFVAAKFEKKSTKQLHKFVSGLPLTNTVKPEYYHCTLGYDKEFSEKYYKPSTLIKDEKAFPLMWEVFGKDTDDEKVLVLRLQSVDLDIRHNQLRELGMNYDFPEYKAHTTVAVVDKDFDTSLLPIPTFPLTISHEYAKPLNPKFKYDPKSLCESTIISFKQFLQNNFLFG